LSAANKQKKNSNETGIILFFIGKKNRIEKMGFSFVDFMYGSFFSADND